MPSAKHERLYGKMKKPNRRPMMEPEMQKRHDSMVREMRMMPRMMSPMPHKDEQ